MQRKTSKKCKGKRAEPTADEQRDAPETVVASTEGHWRGGINRQSQPAAHQQHQVAASQAAAVKRRGAAMPDEERKAKAASHMAGVRAQQAADPESEHRKEEEAKRRREKRAEQKVAREAATKATNRIPLHKLNKLLREDDEESLDEFEFQEFCKCLDDNDDFNEFISECYMDFFDAWREERKYAPPPQPLLLPPLRPVQPAAPAPPPPPDDDPWAGGSADMFYDGPNDHNIAEQRERQEWQRREQPGFVHLSLIVESGGVSTQLQVAKEDYNDGYELQCERWHNEDGRRSAYYLWSAGGSGALPPDQVLQRHWGGCHPPSHPRRLLSSRSRAVRMRRCTVHWPTIREATGSSARIVRRGMRASCTDRLPEHSQSRMS